MPSQPLQLYQGKEKRRQKQQISMQMRRGGFSFWLDDKYFSITDVSRMIFMWAS